jgi:bifunctional non-homologous end joining protein LigD
MLATLGDLPDPPGWGYEFKWDGVRAIIYVEPAGIRVVSRNDRDVSASYPEVAGIAGRSPRRRLVLDGEIVALDERGAPSFSLLQQRMHVLAPTADLMARVPVQLYVFDILSRAGKSTMDLPYRRRREQLDDLHLADAVVSVPPWWADDAGKDLMRAAGQQGLEGVVAKRLDSPYRPGIRSRDWIKTPLNRTIEVLVGGWKPGEGRRSGLIGSLMLGMYDTDDILRYVGDVGTGFTHQTLTDLQDRLASLHRADSPFEPPPPKARTRQVHYVQPQLVGEVSYRTLTPEGRLRHPSWRGLRPDREPDDVRLTNLPTR